MPHTPKCFESLFDGDDDPWHLRSRWYEERKRALTLACLPAQRYASAYEPGCANGELLALLAERCLALLVSDGSAKAVELARARLAGLPKVQVWQAWLPSQWPEQEFDLIVVSEKVFPGHRGSGRADAAYERAAARRGDRAGLSLAAPYRRLRA